MYKHSRGFIYLLNSFCISPSMRANIFKNIFQLKKYSFSESTPPSPTFGFGFGLVFLFFFFVAFMYLHIPFTRTLDLAFFFFTFYSTSPFKFFANQYVASSSLFVSSSFFSVISLSML
ncbi:hypothetical protein, unlikely [Trypanosoma brucei gambiense DAL972]|uniref:Uncharacterized protein n=1 Tax=Trypanosoma brucei gambiense (strain MHOM/CI/86/DAL972) TaxID=679716 RepID=C9ZJ97_TRYB9|nr:hypothetical protein, unlikely [Trypanosoma brucei gambiense DAL972]CBH09456.1 hypothetical protein, unlikely [Trypanosoma brucei gambiense DAL972]|eukprot:XP_011771761.1 hypothetical protein, unlikely [Trypanosoma brucei gambiense DAL972]